MECARSKARTAPMSPAAAPTTARTSAAEHPGRASTVNRTPARPSSKYDASSTTPGCPSTSAWLSTLACTTSKPGSPGNRTWNLVAAHVPGAGVTTALPSWPTAFKSTFRAMVPWPEKRSQPSARRDGRDARTAVTTSRLPGFNRARPSTSARRDRAPETGWARLRYPRNQRDPQHVLDPPTSFPAE